MCYFRHSQLVGLPAYLIRRLQSVQNAAARLIFWLRRSEHITVALISLGLLVTSAGKDQSRCADFSGAARAPLTSCLDIDFGPLPPIVYLFLPPDFLMLDVAPFLSLVHVHGTIYLPTLPPRRLLTFKQRLKMHLFSRSYPSQASLTF